MNPLSAADAERARKFHALVLQKVASLGQRQMAEQLATSESTVSRFVSSDLERACVVLAVLGLKVVPGEMQCYPPAKIAILLSLARDHLNQLEKPEQLSFD